MSEVSSKEQCTDPTGHCTCYGRKGYGKCCSCGAENADNIARTSNPISLWELEKALVDHDHITWADVVGRARLDSDAKDRKLERLTRALREALK